MVQYELEGNTFIISNKVYPYANLAQWGTENNRDMGTFDGQPNYDQLWILREDPNIKGYYTINNLAHIGYRIGKYDADGHKTIAWNGKHDKDQLWKFSPTGEANHYEIKNYFYSKTRMAKWGKGDGDWG